MRESLKTLAEFCLGNEYTGSLEAEPQCNGDVLVRATIRVGEGRRAYKELAVLPLLHLANVREGFDLVGATEERLVTAVIQAVTEDNEKATG
jgi:hypothetical protein